MRVASVVALVMYNKRTIRIVAFICAASVLSVFSFIFVHSIFVQRDKYADNYFLYSMVFGERGVNDKSVIEGFTESHRLGASLKNLEAKVRLSTVSQSDLGALVFVRFWSDSIPERKNVYMRVNDGDAYRISVKGPKSYEIEIDVNKNVISRRTPPILYIYGEKNYGRRGDDPINIILTSVSVYEKR